MSEAGDTIMKAETTSAKGARIALRLAVPCIIAFGVLYIPYSTVDGLAAAAGPQAKGAPPTAHAKPAPPTTQAKPVQAKPPAPDPWYGRATRGSFQAVRAPDQRFQFEYPSKDWTVMAGAGPVPLMALGKRGEIFVVERSVLNRALDQTDIGELFLQLETETLKERTPQAAQVNSRIIEAPDRRVVAIEFTRPSAGGAAERARQYSITSGSQLYRLTCASSVSAFPAYEATCAHMVASFAIAQK